MLANKNRSLGPASPHLSPSAESASPTPMDLAVRLLSETGHDLRAPLATIRESVRLVRDGNVGSINAEQQSLLSAAVDQADCMVQMVDDMTQLERLRTGLPRIHRRWVSVGEIRQSVDQTLRPWATPRSVSVLWDGADSPTSSVFADLALITRLIVNLVTNAVRATNEGDSVLIRLQPRQAGEVIRWSIVDPGKGISEADFTRIASRGISSAGGEGLGWAIARQLAAFHLSDLWLRSRVGLGTEVAFDTAASGPHSVARCWARWRTLAREPRRRPLVRTHLETPHLEWQPEFQDLPATPSEAVERNFRLDPPLLTATLRPESPGPRSEDRAVAGIVSIGVASQRQTAEAFDRLLQNQLRMFDLVYRAETRRWVWVLDADVRDVGQRIEAIEEACRRELPAVRTTWSEPHVIPVDEQRLATRLSDLFVRQSLHQLSGSYNDGNEVRLGTAPIEPSPVASDRLEDELRRLSHRWRHQSSQLQAQAEKLRPRTPQ